MTAFLVGRSNNFATLNYVNIEFSLLHVHLNNLQLCVYICKAAHWVVSFKVEQVLWKNHYISTDQVHQV